MNDKPVIKVGRKKRHITCPNGYQRVTEGVVKEDDLFYNLDKNCFCYVEKDDIGMQITDADGISNFDCIARKTD